MEDVSPVPSQPEVEQYAPPMQSSSPKKKLPLQIIIATAVLVVAIGILASFIYSKVTYNRDGSIDTNPVKNLPLPTEGPSPTIPPEIIPTPEPTLKAP